jgi:hypothetical protein
MSRNVLLGKRLRALFAYVDLPSRSPHKFRHGHAVYALQHAKTMADYKAVSMNLMHEDIRVTDGIYAPLLGNEAQQRIASLTAGSIAESALNDSVAAQVAGWSKAQLPQALMAIAQEMAK